MRIFVDMGKFDLLQGPEFHKHVRDSSWGQTFMREVDWILETIPASVSLQGVEKTMAAARTKISQAYIESLEHMVREGKRAAEEELFLGADGEEEGKDDDHDAYSIGYCALCNIGASCPTHD